MRLKSVFIENLRKYRKERGFSQAALAEKCDTSTSYIGQIEIGNRFPSLELIEKLATALQIRPHLLFFIESDNNKD
jgi:transcriptional regulator with XRE-family HTH domain